MIMILARCAGVAACLSLCSGVAGAQEPDSLGTFNDWEAYTYKASDSQVCFVFSKPKKSEASKKVRRDEVRFMVTHYPGRKVKGQISTIIGYPFKEGTIVKLTIDDKTFDMFPVGDMAWAGDNDKQVVAAMKGGRSMVLKGTSWKGTETTDTYSLSGLTAALQKIDASCK